MRRFEQTSKIHTRWTYGSISPNVGTYGFYKNDKIEVWVGPADLNEEIQTVDIKTFHLGKKILTDVEQMPLDVQTALKPLLGDILMNIVAENPQKLAA